jgi:hypothetical protein
LPAARKKAQRLQAEAESALEEAEAPKLQGRLEDLNVWERELVKEKKGLQDLNLTEMASWREGEQDAQCAPGERQEDGCRGC